MSNDDCSPNGHYCGDVVHPRVDSGPHHFLRNKRQEWEEYRSEVTAFELRKNLPVL
jgi:hypothetical protein